VASFNGCGFAQDRQSKVISENETLNQMTMNTQQDISPKHEPPGTARRMEVVIHADHSKGIRSVALSPDGRYILSGAFDMTAKLWDVTSGQIVNSFGPYPSDMPLWPDEVGFSDDGMTAILADLYGNARGFDVVTGRGRSGTKFLRGATWSNEMFGLHAASPNGDFRVIEPISKRNFWVRGPLIIWNAAGETIRTLETHNSPSTGSTGITNTLTFSRDGRHLAWADTDLMGSGMAKVWEVGSWRLVGTYPASIVNFSRDSRTMVLGGPTGGAPYLLDLASGEETHLESGTRPSGVSDLAMVGDGRSVVAGMHDGRAILWDLTTGHLVRTFECPKDQSVLSVAINPSSPLLATGCADGTAWFWELTTGKLVRNLAPTGPETLNRSTIRFSADGRTLALGAGEQLGIWNVIDAKALRQIALPREELPAWTQDISLNLAEKLHRVRSIALHPNGQLVAIATGLGVSLWDLPNVRLVRKVSDGPASNLQFSPDGRILFTFNDGQTFQWAVDSGLKLPSTAASPQSSSASKYPKLQDSNEIARVERIVYDRERDVFKLSPDGRLSGHSAWQRINVSDIASNTTLRDLKGATDSITGLAFTPNNRALVSGGVDGAVRLWDLQRGKEIAALISLGNGESVTVTPDHYYRASKSPVKGVSFKMDDNLLPFEQFAEKLNKPEIVQQRLDELLSNAAH
jgi:WD40 repeat protein